jgi:hypothetical protein
MCTGDHHSIDFRCRHENVVLDTKHVPGSDSLAPVWQPAFHKARPDLYKNGLLSDAQREDGARPEKPSMLKSPDAYANEKQEPLDEIQI